MYKNALVLAVVISSSVTVASADPVYRWKGPDGQMRYSSTPPDQNAKPADLPPIMRGEVKLTTQKLETCDGHGGVNCQAGPDTDGSVICYDEFKGASALFRFNCNSPKLEISEVSNLNDKGEFTVFVRNSKSVAAASPELIVRPKDIATGIKLDGPIEIEPFGVAEFVYKPESKGIIKNPPSMAQLTVTCANCP